MSEHDDTKPRPGETIDVTPETKPVNPETHGRDVAEYRAPAVPANPFDVEPEAFKKQIEQRGENYQMLVGWLVSNMVEGEDVIQVHVVKRAECDYGGPPPKGNCSPLVAHWHWSDPDLSKKGAEKVCGLLGLGTRFLGMEDFKRAAIKGIDLKHIVIDCELYTVDGSPVSQGTGACSLSEVYDNLNAAMKKACKRAHVDAVKRCAGLSGLATEIKKRMPPPDPEAAARAARDAAAAAAARGNAGGRHASGRKPAVCPIGKHKGAPWTEVPSDYLAWIVDKVDKPDIVAAAAEELARRKSEAEALREDDAPPTPPPEFDDEIPY